MDKCLCIYCLHRYDSSTGTFTVPPGGNVFYYFSAYFVVYYNEYARFDIQINGELICTAWADRDHSDNLDPGHTSCSAVIFAVEGKLLTYLLSKQVSILFFSV